MLMSQAPGWNALFHLVYSSWVHTWPRQGSDMQMLRTRVSKGCPIICFLKAAKASVAKRLGAI